MLKYVEIDRNPKRYLRVVILLTIIFAGCHTIKPVAESKPGKEQATYKPASTDYMEPSTWLLGYISPFQFSQPPHSEWYVKGFDEYQPIQEVIDKLVLTDKENLTIKIVLGTWCPDSRREVPRFMKIIELCGFPTDRITFIGVDNTKNAPIGDFEALGIERVPTFIFLENKVESGRIIENPVASLEQDMLDILTRNEK